MLTRAEAIREELTAETPAAQQLTSDATAGEGGMTSPLPTKVMPPTMITHTPDLPPGSSTAPDPHAAPQAPASEKSAKKPCRIHSQSPQSHQRFLFLHERKREEGSPTSLLHLAASHRHLLPEARPGTAREHAMALPVIKDEHLHQNISRLDSNFVD